MEVFVILYFFIILSIIFFSIKKNKLLYGYIAIVTTLYLIMLSGFRDISIGIDTMSYYTYYNRDLSIEDLGEYYGYQGMLFWLFMSFIKEVFNDYQVVLIIVAIVSVGLISRFIWKYSRYPMISFFIYSIGGFFAIGLSLVRQYLALSIIVYSFDYIVKRDFIKFFITLIIAFCIHPSSVLFLPAYFISRIKVNKKSIVIYLLLLSCSFFIGRIVIDIMSNLFFGGLYIIEIDDDAGGKFTFVAYCIILLITLFRYKILLKNNKNNLILINFLWVLTIIQSTAFIFPIASRVGYMYGIFILILLPEIIYSLNRIYSKILFTTIMIIMLLFVYFYKFYNLNDIYPYKFFFNF